MTRAIQHVHVLTSCTGAKRDVRVPVAAEDLYVGQQHLRLMRGVCDARTLGLRVSVSVVSAGHGIVSGDTPLMPYERTFQGRPAAARRSLADQLEIPTAARRVLRASADLHVVLLGEDYLEACDLDADVQPSAPIFVFAGARGVLRMPPALDFVAITLNAHDTRRFGAGLVALKGEVGGRLLRHIARTRPTAAELEPSDLLGNLVGGEAPPALTASTLF